MVFKIGPAVIPGELCQYEGQKVLPLCNSTTLAEPQFLHCSGERVLSSRCILSTRKWELPLCL